MKLTNSLLTAALLTGGVHLSAQNLRVNHVGYLNDDIKAAVYIGDIDPATLSFGITASDGAAMDIDSVVIVRPWAPMAHAARIYFSSITSPDTYTLSVAKGDSIFDSIDLRIGNDSYSRLQINELPLVYLRQQRCGNNPVFGKKCHQNDGILVLAGNLDGTHIDVTGGWHDASDYLQYLTTSANAVYQMLFAYRENPAVWDDKYSADGTPGANGIADILDEARWGLEWMVKMNPSDSLYLNQIADDRDHRFAGLPADDNVDYGWEAGGHRPVYPCNGRPSGLGKYRNESWGLASSVGKFASSFGLGGEIFADIDTAFSSDLLRRSKIAFEFGADHPGACQTNSTVSPYYYEEDNWADDMELAAMARWRSTADSKFITEAVNYGRLEPVTPWMGADSARHYQWYPFINLGHVELGRLDGPVGKEFRRNLRSGLQRINERAGGNAFKAGVPFIWCSNNLTVALVTQAMLYRDMTGDQSFRELETAARDWLFGVNPWGQTMIIMPDNTVLSSPSDPHSALSNVTVESKPGRNLLLGALVDGPVYASIFNSLWGVKLRNPDRFSGVQNNYVVYHDDYSDYSTNEPTMDGTASLTYMLGRLAAAANE